MNILITSIGKWKSSPEKALFEHYASRLRWKLELKELEVKEINDKVKQKSQESEKLLHSAKQFGAHVIIALDERGKTPTSREFASMIERYSDEGSSKIAFIIGGHAGLDESVRKAARHTFSFGSVTWPHLLVRALLAEQIYRSACIISGHPYHRD